MSAIDELIGVGDPYNFMVHISSYLTEIKTNSNWIMTCEMEERIFLKKNLQEAVGGMKR